MHGRELAGLRVADAARREWREATAQAEAAARDSARELRSRGLAERIPVTDAEVATASAEPRETPAIDPATWAQLKAEQTAQVEADRQARAEASARLTPVTDAEIARYGAGAEPEPEPRPRRADTGQDRAAALEEIRAEVGALSAKVDQLPDPAAERRAEMDQAGIDEPVVHEPQAEPSLEASWQPGDAQGHYGGRRPRWTSDAEPEMPTIRLDARGRHPVACRPGHAEARTQGKHAGAFGTVRCSAVATAPTARSSPGGSRSRRTGTTSRSG